MCTCGVFVSSVFLLPRLLLIFPHLKCCYSYGNRDMEGLSASELRVECRLLSKDRAVASPDDVIIAEVLIVVFLLFSIFFLLFLQSYKCCFFFFLFFLLIGIQWHVVSKYIYNIFFSFFGFSRWLLFHIS